MLDGDHPIARAPDVLAWLFTAGCLCNNARIAPPNGTDHATWSILGDPTEASVIVAARKALIDPEALAKSWPRLREYPFESRRKRMSTLHRFERGTAALPAPAHSFIAFVKGAPKEILALSTRAFGGRW